MTAIYFILYITYAIIQGALVNRFYIKDSTHAGGFVFIASIFAPILTVIVIFTYIGKGILYIARPSAK